MLLRTALRLRAASSATGVSCRTLASHAAPAAAPAAAAAAPDAEHAAWLASIKGNKVVVPKFEWSLEWALPTPVPAHQFTQSPVVIEVTDRNAQPEALIQNGPDVAGGYPDPEAPSRLLTAAEHKARGYGKSAYTKVWFTPMGVPKEEPGAPLFTHATSH